MARYKTIIGRTEIIDFPELMLSDIPAKTDTGAYTSSIHAVNIKEVKNKNGKTYLKFDLLRDHPTTVYFRESVKATVFAKEEVFNSFGHSEERYKVIFKVRIGGKVFRAPFTLADRTTKPFPILLGRTMLNKRFMVDTDVVHIDRKILKSKVNDWLIRDDKTDSEDAK